jgi:hypothetical protein
MESVSMRIDLGSIQMNTLTPDANGNTWLVTGMQGWDSPNQRQSFLSPVGKHGQVIGESMLDGRAIVLQGITKCANTGQFWSCYDQLLGKIANLQATIQLVVYETNYTKYVNVIRSGLPRITFIGQNAFTWEVDLLALDPLKYDNTLTQTPVAATINNAGNFASYPVLTITAGGTFTVTNTTIGAGASITASTAVPTGTVVDMYAHTIKDNAGNNIYSYLAQPPTWWALNPGNNVITKSGTATVRVDWRSAWI